MSKVNYAERLALAKALDFKHGAAFVLAEEVINPTPDRRHTHDWRKLANIPAGKRFRVVVERNETILDMLDPTERERVRAKLEDNPRYVLEPCGTSHAFSQRLRSWLDADAALWDAIVPHFVASPRTFEDVLYRADEIAHVDADDILRFLVETKKHMTFFDLDMLVDEIAAKKSGGDLVKKGA